MENFGICFIIDHLEKWNSFTTSVKLSTSLVILFYINLHKDQNYYQSFLSMSVSFLKSRIRGMTMSFQEWSPGVTGYSCKNLPWSTSGHISNYSLLWRSSDETFVDEPHRFKRLSYTIIKTSRPYKLLVYPPDCCDLGLFTKMKNNV